MHNIYLSLCKILQIGSFMDTLTHEKQFSQYENTIEELKKQSSVEGFSADEEILKLEEKLSNLKKKVYKE